MSQPGYPIRQLWAYNSSSRGHYVYMNTSAPRGEGYAVDASGEAENQLSRITLVQDEDEINQTYEMRFHIDTTIYTVVAAQTSVDAQNIQRGGTKFRVRQLYRPNEPYVVLESDVLTPEGDKLYLSSDGAGSMKLKAWNSPVPEPPDTTFEVDPALLFRVVRPKGQIDDYIMATRRKTKLCCCG